MKLKWKGQTGYQEFYPNAYMRFEKSSNNTVSKVRKFDFVIYPSELHLDRPAIAHFKLTFNNSDYVPTIFTDGTEDFKFNTNMDGYVLDSDNTTYVPISDISVVTFGEPSYNEIGYFIDEIGENIVFKHTFGATWFLEQEFEGSKLGINWEIV